MRRSTLVLRIASLLAAVSCTVAAPVPAHAASAATRDVGTLSPTARYARTVQLSRGTQLVGVAWNDPAASLELRSRSRTGRWSDWASVERSDIGPDQATSDGRQALGRAVSDPIWVVASDQVQLRAIGSVAARNVRVVAITATSAPADVVPHTRSRWSRLDALPATTPARIHPRSDWSAAPPRADAQYATAVRGVVVHHTDTPNGYACKQVPAMLRAIQRYHMTAQGWNDIGYNFVVDRCGGIWEGRAGGVIDAVIGAHTYGFNTGTSGIALLGTHTTLRPSPPARAALRWLIGWRLDLAHVRPTGTMSLTAGSSGKFTAGSSVRVRAVSGHRDLFATSCPGRAAYAELDTLAAQAWRSGAAKVANVTTAYELRSGDPASAPALASVSVSAVTPWANQYTSMRIERVSTGQVLRLLGGRGLLRTARWDVPPSLAVAPWDVRVVVNGARPGKHDRAREAIALVQDVPPDPALTITTAPIPTVTPNGDGLDDDVVLAYTLALDYRLQATLVDPLTGATVATLLGARYVGPTATARELRLQIPAALPAGRYLLRLSLPADPALGRSVREFTLDVVR